MILLMVSTGMRIGALHELRIGDLLPIELNEFGLLLFKIQVYGRSRKNHRYYTFCTPECATAINDYLATSERLGEDIITTGTAAPTKMMLVIIIIIDLYSENSITQVITLECNRLDL